MDIKGIGRNWNPIPAIKAAKEATSARAKTDANNDREGNGAATGEEQKRRKMDPQELADAIQYLESLPGVKENNLSVRLDNTNDQPVVYVEDREGKIVRRIPEQELLQLTSNRGRSSGHLLNKAM